MSESVALTPVSFSNLSEVILPDNLPYEISFYTGSFNPPIDPPVGDAGIEFDYKFYKYGDFLNGG